MRRIQVGIVKDMGQGFRALSAVMRRRHVGRHGSAGAAADNVGGYTHGFGELMGGGGSDWAQTAFGEYYPRSAIVYAAIKVRQDAIARLPLRVMRRLPASRTRGPGDDSVNARAAGEPVGAEHPLQRLLDSPNPFWSRSDLWRATETYLSLWGAAFWGLERDENGGIVEIWPLRPDKMRLIPDERRFIKGFVYMGAGGALVPYLPEDVVWMRYFNPLDEYAGLSPIAPLRQSADMGMDALRANRKLLQNDSTPGIIIEMEGIPTDAEVRDFYARWESRFQGVEKTRRPALLSPGMKASNLGFSPRDMEYIESLRWSLEDVTRVFGVPKVMVGDLENTTFSNFSTARRLFWEDTIAAQLEFYREALQQHLLPHFGGDTLTVQFDLSGVEALKESEENKAKRRRIYVQAGIMTIDEVRRDMNLPPLGS
ncbi:MAG: phage portal protein [Chloroflexi bacterium]|nr:phage portal protein [Chloroflexota bacterium]